GVIEADIDSDVDALTIAETGARVIQLHTGGMCHLDANMTRIGLETLDMTDLDIIFLENIGNLVCPASFDTGASFNLMILSVPEGDDKPLKYPKMFKMVDCLLVNKIDTLPYFEFDLEAVKERAKALNPNIRIFAISARTGEGMSEFEEYLYATSVAWRKG
ncbi:MAG: hydrogenase nickel incorporation protein HypB, partial [Candidatus Izemoplasmatales bacterium]